VLQSFGKYLLRAIGVRGLDLSLGFVFGALLQGLGELFRRLSVMRAGLSTRWDFCEHPVSVGAGLPTQWVGRCLLVL